MVFGVSFGQKIVRFLDRWHLYDHKGRGVLKIYSVKSEGGFQEPIEVIAHGEGGYHVKVRNEYSFIACSSGIGMDFKAANKDQVEELIQVLEGVLEKVRFAKVRDEVFAEIERRCKEECEDDCI